MNKDNSLRITEVFYSLQGESTFVGLPTVFIRLTGCPLRCQYCDTSYAFSGGTWITIDELLKSVADYKTHYVTVTGGEPLAQKQSLSLLNKLCDKNYIVSLETSGALDTKHVDQRVIKILDLKTPGSGESKKNYYDNLGYLTKNDQVKFVICNRNDYEWAKQKIQEFKLEKRCHLLFSPSYTELQPKSLAQWILDDHLPVRMQLQLHKVIWGDVPGR